MKKIILGIACLCLAPVVSAQSTFVEWNDQGRPNFTLNGDQAPADFLGGITTFTDLAAFNAASMTSVENFNGGATAAGAVNTCTEPVDTNSNDVCFAPGNLLAGFALTSSGGGGIVALGDGFLGANQTSTVVGANTFTDTTIIDFSPAVTAVAMDILVGAPAPGDVLITALDGSAGTIGSFTITTTAVDESVFAGFTSNVDVASVIVEGVGGGGELMDNLYFGTAGVAEPVVVPTLNLLGLALMAGVLLLAALFFAWRKQQA